jgi:Bacterial extracellular solute-binding proteins, family 5 Middle.
MMHFSWRTTGPVYQKLYEGGLNDTKTKTTYGTSAEKFMASGPFKVKTWVQGGDLILEKNQNYVRKSDIKLDTITLKVVADDGTKMQLFESGQLDTIELSASNISKYIDDPNVRSYDTQTVRCIEINRTNPDQPILHNNDFLHALYYAMDRTAMAKLCYGVASPLIVSTRAVALDDGTRYRELPVAKANVPENYGYNPTLAKQLFEKALAQENLTKVKLHLNYFTSIPDTKVLSEYLQNTLPKVFGEGKFELEIQGLGSNALTTMQDSISTKPNAYELSWMGWGLTAEAFSPAAKFQVYLSTSPRRVANYGNKDIDKLYAQATSEAVRGDKQKVADLAAQMEKIFFDQVLNVPVFQVQKYTMFSEKVKTPVKLSQPGLEWGFAFMDIK